LIIYTYHNKKKYVNPLDTRVLKISRMEPENIGMVAEKIVIGTRKPGPLGTKPRELLTARGAALNFSAKTL
jgi:hypothetical protein